MQNFSTTQGVNYAAIIAIIVLVCQKFGIVVSQDDLITIFVGLGALYALAVSIVNRFKKGDLTVLGFRK